MSDYYATTKWTRDASEVFSDNCYSRVHEWQFDGGVKVPASASTHVVSPPYADASCVDPEEAFVAAIASCHMLTFLSIAATKRYVVDSYLDYAVGTMAKNEAGRLCMTKVVLRPDIVFSGERQPSEQVIEKMHHLAHKECYIANSVMTEITVEEPPG